MGFDEVKDHKKRDETNSLSDSFHNENICHLLSCRSFTSKIMETLSIGVVEEYGGYLNHIALFQGVQFFLHAIGLVYMSPQSNEYPQLPHTRLQVL